MNNENYKLDHINLTVKNFEKTLKWYAELFDYKLVEEGLKEDGSKWGIIKNENSTIAIGERNFKDGVSESHRINHFGFRIMNIQDFKQKVLKMGLVSLYDGPVSYPHCQSWYFADPTGHEIEMSYWENGIKF